MRDIAFPTVQSLASRIPFKERRWQVTFLFVVTLAILFARRPDQFLHPYIWVEEGKYVLREYLEVGPWILAKPLAGYEQLASKIIALISFKLSILRAPEIALVLTVAFTFGVIAAIAFSPTKLRWPFACAVATLLIPSDAETFAVSAYAFWWAGVLLLLAVLWDADRGYAWLRWGYIVIGGLSSPIIGGVWALLALRAVVERRRSEFIAVAVATIPVVLQILAMRQQQLQFKSFFGLELIAAMIQQFVGGFWISKGGGYLAFVVLSVFVAVAWLARSRLDRYFLLLLATFAVICIIVSLRLPVDNFRGLNRFDAGPRYFFYPFILLSWIMIWLAAVSSMPIIRWYIASSFACALLIAGTGLSRRHDPVDWRSHVLACASASSYDLPFHYIGSSKEMWFARFSGEECRMLISRSLF